jgi:beta-lactamase superfamily II metal-dependent hydrolase
MSRLLLPFILLAALATPTPAKDLRVYFIDVEGGQATLLVAPSGQSLLIDAGYSGFDGRDAGRILAAAREAGLRQIDYLLVTHYHVDHVGGVPELAEKFPILHFVDHGPTVEASPAVRDAFAAYQQLRAKRQHILAEPGNRIPLEGLDVEILSSAGRVVQAPLAGAGQPNALYACTARLPEDEGENPQSIGILITYGRFRLLDLADLTWDRELELVCPTNRIGLVDVYVMTHHGGSGSGSAAMVQALRPRVAVMNNGARKGGTPSTWQVVRDSPGLEDIWQLHFSVEGGPAHNAPERFIANPKEPCRGFELRLKASSDGSFTMTNARNGFTKRYNPR